MKGEWVRGIDEDIWKVKYVIVIGINKQVGRWRGGVKMIMREYWYKMVVGLLQYYLVIMFMVFRIENIILVL